jgi:NADPH-dependent curcumin reductase CurA
MDSMYISKNVGGGYLEAALDVLAPVERGVVCGAIGQYNATEPQPGSDNMRIFSVRNFECRFHRV